MAKAQPFDSPADPIDTESDNDLDRDRDRDREFARDASQQPTTNLPLSLLPNSGLFCTQNIYIRISYTKQPCAVLHYTGFWIGRRVNTGHNGSTRHPEEEG